MYNSKVPPEITPAHLVFDVDASLTSAMLESAPDTITDCMHRSNASADLQAFSRSVVQLLKPELVDAYEDPLNATANLAVVAGNAVGLTLIDDAVNQYAPTFQPILRSRMRNFSLSAETENAPFGQLSQLAQGTLSQHPNLSMITNTALTAINERNTSAPMPLQVRTALGLTFVLFEDAYESAYEAFLLQNQVLLNNLLKEPHNPSSFDWHAPGGHPEPQYLSAN